MDNTFIPGTFIPRGKYIRQLEARAAANDGQCYAEDYATLADKERELRLMLVNPTNWLSQFFCMNRNREDLYELLSGIVGHLSRSGRDMNVVEDWVEDNFGEK